MRCWQLNVHDEFSAAHALRYYEGKCENMHGHNFGVDMCVSGCQLQEKTEILLDFKVLKNILRQTLSTLDHCLLNEKPPFDRLNPTSENMARYLFGQIALGLEACPEAGNVRLTSVSVSEKPGQTATYMECEDS